MRIAILTPDPDYHELASGPAADYRRLLGDRLDMRCWSDAGDLSGFDLILPLLAWGYQRAPDRWYAQLDRWADLPLANDVATLRWNTDKRYLADLEARGIAIVPTHFAASLDRSDLATARSLFATETIVIKPAISGGAEGTFRLCAGDPIPPDVAGKAMLVQPLVPAIADEGEYSLFCFDGMFSHAILKRPAAGDFRVQEQFGGTETGIVAPPTALILAQAALAAAPARPLYARIDMIRAAGGDFQLMELELIEPSLFLEHAPDRGAAFARAVIAAAQSRRGG